jgi:hypothetical protein
MFLRDVWPRRGWRFIASFIIWPSYPHLNFDPEFDKPKPDSRLAYSDEKSE